MKESERKARATELRRLAEARVGARAPQAPTPDHADALRLLHELEVHETELELQYEELTRAHEEAEAALRRAVDLYESAPFAYFTVTSDGTVLGVNVAAERLLARGRDAIMGRSLEQFIAPADRGALAAVLAAAHERAPLEPRELALFTEDGASRFVQLSASRSAHGEECRVVGVDVSDRHSVERRLRDAEKLAAVGRLAAGVAHDFNNLLSLVLAHAELAGNETTVDAVAEHLDGVRQAAERGATLTRQLLAFGSGQPSRPTRIDVNATVAALARMLRRIIDVNVEIHCDLDVEHPWVEAEPSLLDQVVVNLALNARDAMPTGGTLLLSTTCIDLTVEGTELPTGGGGHFVRISVTDTGTGIDEATRARIFEPFFTTKRASGGTGLGLATVWNAVSRSGGTVTVRSAPGKGSTFAVHLPRAAALASEPREPKAAREDLPGFEGATVLLVEDLASLRKLVARTLAALGLRVLTAEDGVVALEVAARHPGAIDLLLTDVHMPLMTGGQLAKALQSSRPETRVLFMTGDVSDVLARLGAADDTRVLAKPFSLAALGLAVREVLDSAARL